MRVQYTVRETVDKYFPIYFYRKHLDIAARDLLGLDLCPHHRMILRDWSQGKPINMLFSSRGMGKSVLLAIYYVLMSMLYPKLKSIAVAGQGFRGSKMVLMECERIINGYLSGQRQYGYAKRCLPDPRRVISKDPAYWSITFSNGSIIYGIPLGATSDGNTIRGLRSHLLGQDEAFMIPTKLYQAVLDPMQNVLYDPNKPASEQAVKNMSISISTCDFDFRDFYRQYLYYKAVLESDEDRSSTEIQKEDISLFNFDLDDSYYTLDGEKQMKWGVDYDRIMKKKALPTTDPALWMAENKNIPLNLQGGYFPFEEIEKGMNIMLDMKNETYPGVLDSCSAQCILGVDTAVSKDNTAFVIIKAGHLMNHTDRDVDKCMSANMGKKCPFLGVGKRCNIKKYSSVIFAYEENKMSQQKRVDLIYELLERYNIVAIAMDFRGGGGELADLLRDSDYIKKRIGPTVKAIYDPDRNPNSKGLPMLNLYSTNQETNLVFNGYMKGIISNQTLLFPRPLRDRPENPRLLESAGHVESLINQIARIKAYPAGRNVKFEIESIDSETGRKVPGRKDLYSALMMAVGRMREMVEEQENTEVFDPNNLALPVAFNM